MPKNKNKPNAFYYFMLDWKQEEEKNGRKFFNGIRDVQADPRCSAAWQDLSAEQRNYYKKKEKDSKLALKENKKASTGENMEMLRRSEEEKKKFKDDMLEYISRTVKKAKKNKNAQDLKFYVVHVNYFYLRQTDNDEVEYCPAEIALAEFSLKEGITNTYEKIIKSNIQTGYASLAMEYSNSSHQIPIKPDFGESDYKVLYRDICKFLEPGREDGKLPPLYTLYEKENVKNPVQYVLKMIENSDNNFTENFIIYSFEELFGNLYNLNKEENSEIDGFMYMIASRKITEDPLDYLSNVACKYHQDIHAGINYCSKSYIQRWIYILCMDICEDLNIQLIPGHHIPIEDTNDSATSEVLNSFTKLTFNETSTTSSAKTRTRVKKSQYQHPSERTREEEEARRNTAKLKQLEIIDHTLINNASKSSSEPAERPLRPPLTKPIACAYNPNDISLTENNFPSFGRGAGNRQRTQESRPTRTDYASCFKRR